MGDLASNLKFSNKLVFFVNGKKIEDENVDPEWTLLHYLRRKLHLCGTKYGCGEGGCGACTVMVSRYDRKNKKEIHIPVNACLALVSAMHGMAVVTVEGIGSSRTRFHPVQERIAKAHGSQCGFCTPGIVMSMYTLLRQKNKPKMDDIEEAFQGNLCRCTGYRPIIEGYKTFSEEWELVQNQSLMNGQSACSKGKGCCKLQERFLSESPDELCLFKSEEFVPYHPSQEPIFPPELKLYDQYDQQYIKIKGPISTWHRPIHLKDVLILKALHPEAKLIVGNTEIGVEKKFKSMHYPILIHIGQIPELQEIQVTNKGVKLGAAVTITDINHFLTKEIEKQPEEKSRIFKTFNKMLYWFGGKQIRSVGSIGGNIITGSPISDLVPILMACKAELEIANYQKGKRIVTMGPEFFVGYRKTILTSEDLLLSITLPFSKPNQHIRAYKQSKRREDDIAIVVMAISVTFLEGKVIDEISFGIGGVSSKTVDAPKTQQGLKGKVWSQEILNRAYTLLSEDIKLEPDAPGGMVAYRQILILSLFLKFFLSVSKEIKYENCFKLDSIDSAIHIEKVPYKSSQYFCTSSDLQQSQSSIHKPVVHLSAFKQASGEAVYIDDMTCYDNELFVSLVLSTKANANIISIDVKKIFDIPGVIGFLSADDITDEQNQTGYPFKGDELLFYNRKVSCVGQVIGIVVATNQTIAQQASREIIVVYEELTPILITIEDAIRDNSFFEFDYSTLEYGNVDEAFKKSAHIIEGSCKTGNQKHFYMETQGVICVPKEDNGMDIFSSTQCPTVVAAKVASLLDVTLNKISVITKRLGGGFGGKEWKSVPIALYAALAANRFQRPVRLVLDRDEDMLFSGGRPSYLFKYKAGCDKSGKILGCEFEVYINSGYSIECTGATLTKVLNHLDNAFSMPSYRVKGHLCKTNIQSNTAMRGFGGPEAAFASMSLIEDIAQQLDKNVIDIIMLNMYKQKQLSFNNQPVDSSLWNCFNQCLRQSKFYEKKAEIEKFNRDNLYKKRGIAIMPSKFGIGFDDQVPWFSQAAAIINVFVDGSVMLHHGGVEMGQGLHTKLIQIASSVLDIPASKIYTEYNSTIIVPNCSPSIGSLTTDLFGPAVIDACQKIMTRLKPIKETYQEKSWDEWVVMAYNQKISLSATGYFGRKNHEKYFFHYFVCGSACSEVEIDTLTGDHQVLTTDLVMDLGKSLNPAIDIGQIEGAFMQGYGLLVLEESLYSPTGQLLTKTPGTYKIPGFGDIPKDFNVSLIQEENQYDSPKAVYSSKAVGEPPLGLAASVYFAIIDAMRAARKAHGVMGKLKFESPATAEKIRLGCIDDLVTRISSKSDDNVSTGWSIRS